MNKTCCLFSLLLIVSFALPTVAEPVVIGETSTIQSEILDEQRGLMVHLPDGYETSQASYPVVYLLDARSNFHHTTGTIKALSRAGHVPDMIVVAIMNTDRTRDLTPTADSPDEETGEVEMPTAGGADNFLRFINEELIPHVEKTYRTAPFRILIGHSFGGLFAIHALVESPNTFDAYIAISPSLHWDDGELVERAEAAFANVEELNKYVFMSIADEGMEMLSNLSRLSEYLRYSGPDGLIWDFRVMEGDDHGTVPIRSTYLGLRMIYPRWRTPRGFFDEPTLAGLQRHYSRLSEEYGYAIPVPESRINMLGYMVMGNGDVAGAIEIFELNVEKFPDSANVYDSLAEGLETDEQYAAARENYEQAYERGQGIEDPNTEIFKRNLERMEAKVAEMKETTETARQNTP